MLNALNRSQNHSLQDRIDASQNKINKSIRLSTNLDMLNDYEKLSTTYHEYIRGNDISNDIEVKGRNRSKRKFKHNITDAKKRLSRLKKLSDLHERGLLQTVSPDIENKNPLITNSKVISFLKSNDNFRNNCHTSMSITPDSHSITPMNIVKSTFASK